MLAFSPRITLIKDNAPHGDAASVEVCLFQAAQMFQVVNEYLMELNDDDHDGHDGPNAADPVPSRKRVRVDMAPSTRCSSMRYPETIRFAGNFDADSAAMQVVKAIVDTSQDELLPSLFQDLDNTQRIAVVRIFDMLGTRQPWWRRLLALFDAALFRAHTLVVIQCTEGGRHDVTTSSTIRMRNIIKLNHFKIIVEHMVSKPGSQGQRSIPSFSLFVDEAEAHSLADAILETVLRRIIALAECSQDLQDLALQALVDFVAVNRSFLLPTYVKSQEFYRRVHRAGFRGRMERCIVAALSGCTKPKAVQEKLPCMIDYREYREYLLFGFARHPSNSDIDPKDLTLQLVLVRKQAVESAPPPLVDDEPNFGNDDDFLFDHMLDHDLNEDWGGDNVDPVVVDPVVINIDEDDGDEEGV